jgi:F0F1-type ATP synthase membrane subunit c/vacuolar-type H+-ATPase subunit K
MVSQDQMDIVSSEIVSAIHQIIVNGAALIACTQRSESTPPFFYFYFLFFIFYFLF